MRDSMVVRQNDLGRQYALYADEYRAKALEVLDSGWYVLGRELGAFEREWAAYVGVSCCAGVASGLDALTIAFRALGIGPGDEVVVAANAYVACVMGITINGATPVFVEPGAYHNIDASKIERALTAKTRAILVVHLFGQCCDMDAIMEVAREHGLRVVEDCAQAHGSTWAGGQAGSFGDVSCFSFYPTKNLGAFGDGGAVATNDPALDEQVRMIRNYGSRRRYHNDVVGMNSRLDELQAGLLRVKLAHLDELCEERRTLARAYSEGIDNPLVEKPVVRTKATPTWHQYVVRCERRDELMAHLSELGVGTLIHYPVPPHLQPAYAYLGHEVGDFPIAEREAQEVLSLPMYNGMTREEVGHVIEAVNSFR